MNDEAHETLLESAQETQAAKEEARKQAHARAWELARQQGVKPIQNMDDLKGDFWPEEESVDDFLTWIRATRQGELHRKAPE
jgi:glycerol-3-phosphate O-acyltransferase